MTTAIYLRKVSIIFNSITYFSNIILWIYRKCEKVEFERYFLLFTFIFIIVKAEPLPRLKFLGMPLVIGEE